MVKRFFNLAVAAWLVSLPAAYAQRPGLKLPDVSAQERAVWATSTDELKSWMTYLSSDELRGRLSGDKGYDLAANYVAELFKSWGLEPGGDNGTFFQTFAHPYTIVPRTDGYFKLHLPMGKEWITKEYAYPDNYMVGGTSDTGLIEGGEMVYVGYGITAPELGYDSYKGIDVKGKVVVCERDVPYTGKDEDRQRAWMPYQYHSHKMSNAFAHGAAGMVYLSTGGNPNPGYNKGFIYCCAGEEAAKDMFAGTGKEHAQVIEQMKSSLKPISFKLNTRCDIQAYGEFHPEGKTENVIGILRGTDATLAPEYITIGAHLDHIGLQPYVCPGAMDNASGTVIIMGTAKALATSGYNPRRTLVFVLFAGEETGLFGSDWLANHPIMPNEQCKALLNIDCLGVGYGFGASIASKNNSLWDFVERACAKVNRPFLRVPGRDKIVTRPRTDEANFFLKGIPTIAPFAFGGERVPYHVPGDTMEKLDFDLIHDAVKWMTFTLIDLSSADEVKAYKKY